MGRLNIDKAKEKWFDENVIMYSIKVFGNGGCQVLKEYSKEDNYFGCPYTKSKEILATRYKIRNLKPYQVYFLFRHHKKPGWYLELKDVKMKDALI